MSQTLSSAYAGLAKLLTDAGHIITPAELQGILWGRTVAGASSQPSQVIPELSSFLEEGEITEAIQQAITGLQEMVNKELTDGSVAVTLLMPIDDESLSDRLNALTEWSNGFLSGFGSVKQTAKLAKEVLEILEDLASITQLDTNIAVEDEARSEGDYTELVEFLRVAPLLVATELKSKASTEQTVH
ncbi:UPF0149 family protein [Entomomonas asaccharolytica]|uniref:UPF0149 family protein n=1 Tax=Entomomonas asaccharolytica TaxID=2785331 RepID=A0A974NDP5_9GAMM|nr:UPF0149 family protein [Entomomonas asaccharolytica]QQP84609.1 UPF0149 family protein [Entomomonas asaccharolytica]